MPDEYVLRLEASGEVTPARPDDATQPEDATQPDAEPEPEEVEQ